MPVPYILVAEAAPTSALTGYPPKPDVAYDYSAHEESAPTVPPPGGSMDNDYANHKTSIDAAIDFMKTFVTSTGRVKTSAMPTSADLQAYVETATDAADEAEASATAAATSATNAAASAVAAAATAGSINSTSTTSVAIATGSKSFTTQTAKNFAVGGYVTIASAAAPATDWMFGQITAYNSGTGALVVTVALIGGSGTHTDWTISISGARGATGATGATGAAGSAGSGSPGQVDFFHGRIGDIPAGFLPMNGAAVSRVTYAALLAVLVKSAVATLTIASPAVVSWVGHGLDDGDPISFATTGALPTGLTAAVTYYVKAVGANSFQLAATPGGAAIVTTGSQSGTHTATSALCGVGDGVTTFNTPDWRGVGPMGHDMMGSTAAGNLTFANEGIYGRGAGIQGANSSVVVNVQHNHSYGSARLLGTSGSFYAFGSDPGGAVGPFDVPTSIDNAGGGTTGNAGTASQRYTRVGKVAVGIWIIKT